jgi:hypothetical protein
MTWKQIKELREDLNKHQSKTKDSVKREIHELKRTTQIIKEEMNKDMEEKEKQKSWKYKVPIVKQKHSGGPLQQTRTSGRQNLRAQR